MVDPGKSAICFFGGIVLTLLTVSVIRSETLDELYKNALKEEAVVNCYCSLAQINVQKIYPVFEKRFPGVKINHVDATSDKLAVHAITEARGGRVLADVFEFGLENILQLYEQKLLLDKPIPEAAEYPANLKGSYWLANNLIFFVGAWNSQKLEKAEEPKSFDDFAEPTTSGNFRNIKKSGRKSLNYGKP